MTVRLGRIELTGVQGLHTEEQRTLVEQRAPEQQGSAFQDLGREPVTIVLDGFIHGEDAASTLEALRSAQSKAEPLSFAADIAVGTDLTDVVIESVRVRQIAGYRSRYSFVLRLREHVEPPEPAGAGDAAVDQAAREEAAAWADDSLQAAAVLQDPASLADAMAANPALLDQVDMGDMADALGREMDALPTERLDGVLGAIAEVDPSKADALLGQLKEKGSLGSMLMKYVQDGVAFLRTLDPSKLTSLMKAFKGGLEFLKQLKEVVRSVAELFEAIRTLEAPPLIKGMLPAPPALAGGA
jgi:hypothetical protein